jgi:hypothetical protein
MKAHERAVEILSSAPEYDTAPVMGWKWDWADGDKVRVEYEIPASLTATVWLSDLADRENLVSILASAGYCSVNAPAARNGVYRNVSYGTLVTPEHGDDILFISHDSYPTMCGGAQVRITSVTPDTMWRVYQTGRTELAEAMVETGSDDLRDVFLDNSIGILTIQVDTAESNAIVSEYIDRVVSGADGYDDMSYVREEYPSPVHEGQTAIMYVIHCMWEDEHFENSSDDWGGDMCFHCGQEMGYNEEMDCVWCWDCECDDISPCTTDDDEIDGGGYADLREGWMAHTPTWRQWTQAKEAIAKDYKSEDCCIPTFYGGIRDDHTGATAACWRISTLHANRTMYPKHASLEIRSEVDADTLLTEAIFSALRMQPVNDSDSAYPNEDHVDIFHENTERLRVPVFISSNVGCGSQSTLNVMKNLYEQRDYIESRFGCKVVYPEGIAANPKEGYHYTDSLTLVPTTGGI